MNLWPPKQDTGLPARIMEMPSYISSSGVLTIQKQDSSANLEDDGSCILLVYAHVQICLPILVVLS